MNEYYCKEIIEAQEEIIEIYKKRGRISSFNKGKLESLEKYIERLKNKLTDDEDDDFL
jgi:hypothetical protein